MNNEKKAVYFNNSYNAANPATGVTCIVYDETTGFQFINNGKVITVVSTTDKQQNAELDLLKAEIKALKFEVGGGQIVTDSTVEVITVKDNIDASGKDVIIEKTTTPIDKKIAVTGKTVVVKSAEIDNKGLVTLTSDESITVDNLTTTGDLPKTVSNAPISMNPVNGEVLFTGGNIGQTSYNCIEIGLAADSVPTNITVKDTTIAAVLSNNAINIFNTADGAVIDIIGCTIKKCSNPIRISNKNNGKVTLNITDCEFTEWDNSTSVDANGETIYDWAGMIICQDYTSGSETAAKEANLFAPEKVTINIKNCTKNGVLIKEEDFTVGTFKENQILYVWNAYADGGKIYKYIPETVKTTTVTEEIDGVETTKEVTETVPAVDNSYRYPTINFL
jgi:hypothetical protein